MLFHSQPETHRQRWGAEEEAEDGVVSLCLESSGELFISQGLSMASRRLPSLIVTMKI